MNDEISVSLTHKEWATVGSALLMTLLERYSAPQLLGVMYKIAAPNLEAKNQHWADALASTKDSSGRVFREMHEEQFKVITDGLRIMFVQLIPDCWHEEIAPEKVHKMAWLFTDALTPTLAAQAKVRAAAEKLEKSILQDKGFSAETRQALIELQGALYGEAEKEPRKEK